MCSRPTSEILGLYLKIVVSWVFLVVPFSQDYVVNGLIFNYVKFNFYLVDYCTVHIILKPYFVFHIRQQCNFCTCKIWCLIIALFAIIVEYHHIIFQHNMYA